MKPIAIASARRSRKAARARATQVRSAPPGGILAREDERSLADAGALAAVQTPESPDARPTHEVRLVEARAGDHAAVHRLLLSIFHAPSAADFHAQLDEPLYEPTDRLLVKDRGQILAHLRLTRREIRFGELTLPVAGFMDLATSHESRSRGYATSLLVAGQQQAVADGALVGLARTTAPDLFLRQGWSVCGRQSFSVAGPRQVLAHFCNRYPHDEPPATDDENAGPAIWTPTVQPIVVRPLRRIELPAVMRLYEQAFAGGYGPLVRSEAWWDWLMARGAFDRAYVAILGNDAAELPRLLSALAGCAFVKEGRIVELLHAAGQDRVARRLVARVCADAVEHNLASVRLDAPPRDPLHEEWAAAGGTTHYAASYQGETCMARLFDPLAMLRLLSAALLARAKAAELPLPLSLGLDIYHYDADLTQSRREDMRSYRLVVGQRRVKLLGGNPGRSYLSLARRDLTPLLLGHWDVAKAISAGRLRASTRLAQDAAEVLFPQLPWHRPPLDELIA